MTASLGLPCFANPDLVERFRSGLPRARGNRETFCTGHGDAALGYTDDPPAC